MARMTLTQKLDSAILALRNATTTITEQGAKIAALEQQLAERNALIGEMSERTEKLVEADAPKHVERETESEEPVSGFKALWNRAKKLTAVTGISHFVRGDKVYRGYGRDVVAIV